MIDDHLIKLEAWADALMQEASGRPLGFNLKEYAGAWRAEREKYVGALRAVVEAAEAVGRKA